MCKKRFCFIAKTKKGKLTSLRCPSISRKETAADLFGQEGQLKSFVVVLISVILRGTLFILSFWPDTASTFPGQISFKGYAKVFPSARR